MFLIETVSSANIADICVTSARSLLYGVIELNVKDTFPIGAAARILSGGAATAASADAAAWPSAMAIGVANTLQRIPLPDAPTHVMGTFLSISDGLIHICWAGTMRVHQIRLGATIRETNAHNVIDDPIDGVTEFLLSESPDFVAGSRFVASRVIGPQDSRPTESQVWEMQPRDILLICSAYVHRNASSSEYAPKFTRNCTEMLGYDSGLISVIRTAPPLPRE